MANEAAHKISSEPTWLFVGDFLFYLRLLARQFAAIGRSEGNTRKNMVIVPEPSMAWEQIEGGHCEVVILDCVEASETQLSFIRRLRRKYPQVRVVLVSAALNQKMEAGLMEAGVHLCFAKPRTTEEAGSVYQLMDALTRSEGFYPNGSFKGLAPARFIQFLCARGESGRVAMDTDEGEAFLVIESGRIVDASLGELRGDAAAAKILSLDRTERCHFKHMLTSQFHTINLHTHQLWLDSDRLKAAVPVKPQTPRRSALVRSISDAMNALDALERMSLQIHLEAPADHENFSRLLPPATGGASA
jgi:CheY-like chemotaxis protein